MDLTILHRSGRHNENADALSRHPHSQKVQPDVDTVDGVVATLIGADSEDLATLQRQDTELRAVINYLETGVLPQDDRFARRLALTQSQFVLEEGVLYRNAGDVTLQVVPPECMRQKLFEGAHCQPLGGHLGDAKVHSQLQKHCWWGGM